MNTQELYTYEEWAREYKERNKLSNKVKRGLQHIDINSAAETLKYKLIGVVAIILSIITYILANKYDSELNFCTIVFLLAGIIILVNKQED